MGLLVRLFHCGLDITSCTAFISDEEDCAMHIFLLLSGLKQYAVEDGPGPFANNPPEIQFISATYADNNELNGEGGFTVNSGILYMKFLQTLHFY